jgi:CRISPR-associated protein Csx10
MPAIIITIKTIQPILATSFQGDPNSDVSYDYIPGSMMRGALIGRYLRQSGLWELNLDEPETQRLFFQPDSTRYLNAYLVSRQEPHRTLPVPLSWYKEKGQELTEDQEVWVYDQNVEQDDEQDSLKPLRGSFCTVEDCSVRLYEPQRRINIHNARDRRKGRSSKREDQADSEGAIFRYDALDAGQAFQAVILCESQDVQLFKELLAQPDLWLGGSRSAGYGQTRITYSAQETWQEFPDLEDEDSSYLTITLLSDTLLRDANGQPSADPKLIAAAINEICGSDLASPERQNIFSRQTYIGGFNRKWGLPLPQVPALAAGTVIVFTDGTLTDAQIQQLHWQGIGDRRNEGFGRVAVNWNRQASIQVSKPPKARPTSSEQPPPIGATSLPLAQRMAKQLLHQNLDQVLKAEVGRRKLVVGSLSNSQLSRLRLAARQGLNATPVNLQFIGELIDEKNLTKTALEQFQKNKFSQTNKPLHTWLKEISKNPQSWIVPLPEVELSSEVKESVDESLAIEYTLKLIMAVAKQATKENQQ